MKDEIIVAPALRAGSKKAEARWMVVDDNPDCLNLMARLLSYAGDAAVYSFESVDKAWAAFQKAPEAWELVLTDLEMPGVDGIELCSRLQTAMPRPKIFLTTGSNIITEDEAVHLGFCGLLRKPFLFSALLRTLLVIRTANRARPPVRRALRGLALQPV